MRDPFRPAAFVHSALEAGRLVEALVFVPICAGARVPVRVIVPAGDDWVSRAEICATVTVEAVRQRLRSNNVEGDRE